MNNREPVICGNCSEEYKIDDRDLILWALLYGDARWDKTTEEFCFDGLRHGTDTDSSGVPFLTGNLRSRIAAKRKASGFND